MKNTPFERNAFQVSQIPRPCESERKTKIKANVPSDDIKVKILI